MNNLTPQIEKILVDSLLEIPANRIQAIDDAVTNWGTKARLYNQFENEIGYHELLDRCSILQNNVEEFLLSHPVSAMNEEVYTFLYVANELLAHAYQAVGKADALREQRELEDMGTKEGV